MARVSINMCLERSLCEAVKVKSRIYGDLEMLEMSDPWHTQQGELQSRKGACRRDRSVLQSVKLNSKAMSAF